jgi:hypothetical protein
MEKELNLKLLEILKKESWDKAVFSSVLSDDGGSHSNILLYKNNESQRFLPMEIFDLDDMVKQYYSTVKSDPEKRFNKFELEVLPDNTYKVNCQWEEEYFKKDQLDTARLFPQWVNNQMISLIYASEFPNGPTDKDDDGDPIYVSTWDRGIFTFKLENRRVEAEVILYKNDIARIADFELPNYFVEALVEHYEITNKGILEEDWNPWNKLVIHSPHNDLPYARMDEYVLYALQ